MFNKFKSALYNVVGSFDPNEGGSVASVGPAVSSQRAIGNLTVGSSNKEKLLRFPYTRPYFLQLSSEEEILVTADHAIRPIICPRDISRLPWNAGYAETINAGKSKRNEDQASIHVGLLTKCVARTTPSQESEPKSPLVHESDINGYMESISHSSTASAEGSCSLENSIVSQDPLKQTPLPHSVNQPWHKHKSQVDGKGQLMIYIPYYYFGVFDGHAGWGAAVSASNQLHQIIHEKLCDNIDLLLPELESLSQKDKALGPLWYMEKTVSPESAVTGALEQAFWTMDKQIGEDRLKYQLNGGCTACIGLFILGKLFVANAGDSRGILGLNSIPYPMSFDFTPESETQRIRKLGAMHPELLGGEFTHLEFLRKPLKRDLGKKVIYRDHYMSGWAYKTIKPDDLKYPLVNGEGKRSRVLATIGVTRGFGDHDLRAQFSSLPIKPFLSPEPEVQVFDLSEVELADKDVLILGTDGLWDITSNEKAVECVWNSLEHFPPEDTLRHKYRYTSAAQDLVMGSRGKLKDHNWRIADHSHATIDDISVFVVPLKPYQEESKEWLLQYNSLIKRETAKEAISGTQSNTPSTTCTSEPGRNSLIVCNDVHTVIRMKENSIMDLVKNGQNESVSENNIILGDVISENENQSQSLQQEELLIKKVDDLLPTERENTLEEDVKSVLNKSELICDVNSELESQPEEKNQSLGEDVACELKNENPDQVNNLGDQYDVNKEQIDQTESDIETRTVEEGIPSDKSCHSES